MKAWKRHETEGKLKIALLTALIAAGSQIAIPLPLVPVNLALLFVLLAGLILPWRRAVAAV